MKISVLLIDGIKQIMMTPETDNEKEALRYIGINDEIQTVIRRGTFCDNTPQIFGMEVYECQGDYYRAKPSEESIMFVLRPKKKEEKVNETNKI